MINEPRILVVDDEAIALQNLMHVLKKEGYSVLGTQSGAEAVELLEREPFDLVLTDLKMERVDGMEVLKRSKEINPDVEVIMITGYATVASAIEAMKRGAYHYIAKPFKLDEVRKVVKEALEKVRLKRENITLKSQLKAYANTSGIITANKQMKNILSLAAQAASSDSNIVINGESGTGKELLARFIHASSRRTEGPLLSINCGALNEELLTNELFGHEKGAFTGADALKIGLIEQADRGTLFLDEITEMPVSMQVKLLRVLQEKEVLRVGGTRPIRVDVRFIAATNRNLQEEVQLGHFRNDLYFRINVVSITLPPLAARKDDIPALIRHFLNKYSVEMKKNVTAISPEVADILTNYEYPGNVRELENIIERGVALTGEDTIRLEHLPDDLRGRVFKTFRRSSEGRIPSLEDQEKAYIQWVLKETDGNKTLAAQYLAIDRVSLWRKLKKYGLS
ncbi:MAG: sigma-54 dependent transcriptional regulator [Desulfobulbaceae bacterium]|jgi:DNA-binding NtrC family response regulator|nr:sigma-54 dependent transcriptional regulator [Desulfobulbaceae bacterium]MDY0352110.1 sigma-54 dependent transcriptional regulator [Desulfobulbaceae bacterium]